MKLHEIIKEEFKVSTEAVDPQGTGLYQSLVEELSRVKKILIDKPDTKDHFKGVSEVIKRYTNINVKMTYEDSSNPNDPEDCTAYMYCIPATINKNHVFIQEGIRGFIEDLSDKPLKKKFPTGVNGSVSIDKNWVDGDFTKLENIINISTYALTRGHFSPEELTAILMHELGHLFTFFELVDRIITTNQVMAELLSNLTKTNDIKERITLLQNTNDKMKLQLRSQEITNIASKKPVIATQILIYKTINSSNSLNSSPNYDLVSKEQCADQYVVRCGAGVPLAMALEKMIRYGGGDVWKKSQAGFFFTEIISFVNMIAQVVSGAGFLAGSIGIISTLAGGAMISVSSVGLLLAAGIIYMLTAGYTRKQNYKVGHPLYDNFRERVRRIKEDLINQLKYTGKSSRYYIHLLDDIRKVELLHNQFDQRNGWLIKYVNKIRLKEEMYAKELESLAANDLFVLGNEFKYNKS